MALQPGDRVAVHLEKSIDEVTTILAITMAGAIVVNVNAVLKARQVKHILSDSGAETLVTSYSRLKTLGRDLQDVGTLRRIIACGRRVAVGERMLQEVDVIDVLSAVATGRGADQVARIDRNRSPRKGRN